MESTSGSHDGAGYCCDEPGAWMRRDVLRPRGFHCYGGALRCGLATATPNGMRCCAALVSTRARGRVNGGATARLPAELRPRW